MPRRGEGRKAHRSATGRKGADTCGDMSARYCRTLVGKAPLIEDTGDTDNNVAARRHRDYDIAFQTYLLAHTHTHTHKFARNFGAN